MDAYPRRLLVLVAWLWLTGCGAGGNNNIFDLLDAGRGVAESRGAPGAASFGLAPGVRSQVRQAAGDASRLDRLRTDLVAQIFHGARLELAAFGTVDQHGGVHGDVDQVV